MTDPKKVKDLSKANWPVSLVTRILIFVITLQPSLAFAQAPLALKAHNGETSKNKGNTKPPAATPKPIPCPTKNPQKPILASESPLRHTVLLTWKAAADNSTIAGYCIYRSQTPKIQPIISACPDCQLVSEVSLPTTGCVDDRVENDKTYYYVVVAAASEKVLSRASNEATAKIPKENNTSPAASSYPLCRPTESVDPERVKTEH